MEDKREILATVDYSTKNSYLQEGCFIEVVDVKKLNALLRSKNACRKDTKWWEDIHLKWTHLMENKQPNEFNFLTNFLQTLEYDEKKKEWYKKVNYFSQVEHGRLYPEGCESLGQFRRELRHFMCKDLYWDIDIINAHPTILLNLCEGWEIPCEKLNFYIQKREKVIKQVIKVCGVNRDTAKACFIAVINGGKYTRTLKEAGANKNEKGNILLTKFMDEFQKEMKTIIKLVKAKVLEQDNGKKLYNELTEGKTFNKDGTFMAGYICMWEHLFLQQLFNFAEEHGIITPNSSEIVLCHDGAMIRKDKFTEKTVEEFIEELNEYICEISGMDLKFKSKAFDEYETIEKILTEEKINWNEEYVDPFYAKYGIHRYENIEAHDEDIAQLFYNQQVQAYRFCEKTLYKLDGYGLYKGCSNKKFADDVIEYMGDFMDNEIKRCSKWNNKYMARIVKEVERAEHIHYEAFEKKVLKTSKDDEEIKARIDNYKSPFDLYYLEHIVENCEKIKVKEEAKCVKKLRNQTSKQSIVSRIVEKYTDDDFEELLDTQNNLLGFENGVYDVDTHIFRTAKNGEYISMSCGYKFFDPEKPPEEVVRRCEELFKILNAGFHEEKDTWYILKANARCLRGDSNREEVAHFYKGCGSNMKSVIMDMMRNVMGDYYYTLSYKYFTQESKDCRDPSLYHSAKKRCIEVGEPNQAFTFNSDVFKRTTGNDIIKARTNFQSKDRAFKMGNIFIPSNHTVKFNSDTGGNSMKRRVRGIEFPMKFVSKEDFEKLTKEEKESGLIKLGDPTLKDKINEGYFNQAFMLLLIKAYKLYEKEGLVLTPNFIKSTENYFKDLSKDRAWFDTRLKKESGGRVCMKTLRLKFCEDNGCSRTANWFGSKCKEYYGETAVKVNCLGYKYEDYDPKAYRYYKGENAEKTKGMMLDGYIIKPDVFAPKDSNCNPCLLHPDTDTEEEEEEDPLDQNIIKVNKKVKKKIKIKKKQFKFTSTTGKTGFIDYS